MKFLIVGLGNIGDEYRNTRHNIGFTVLDALAEASNISFKTERYGDVAQMRVKNQQLVLLKPSTYMNLSGNAVRYWKEREGIDLDHILVVVDDCALPFGAIRIKASGSDAGHNGLKNIAAMLGTQAYPRLRFGIGNDFPPWLPGGLCPWQVPSGRARGVARAREGGLRRHPDILSRRHRAGHVQV